MHYTLDRSNVIFEMSKANKPVLTLKSGDTVTMETEDCFGHRITSEDQRVGEQFDFSHVNPATGPIHVEGASPGDCLLVTIDRIELDSQGVIETAPGWGVLGDKIRENRTIIADIFDNIVSFRGLSFPARPMIGVIGTAPLSGAVGCGTPGKHGGNLDTTEITVDSVVNLPVFVPGALLALGDVHALMGDGESCGTGVECRATLTITVELAKGQDLSGPLVQDPSGLYVLFSSDTLENAVRGSLDRAVSLISAQRELSWVESYMIASVACNVKISQLVNPLITARTFIPNSLLSSTKGFSSSDL